MEYHSQTLKRINQEALRDQNQGHDLNLQDGIFPTRAHSPIHWGSNPRKILGSYRIYVPLI